MTLARRRRAALVAAVAAVATGSLLLTSCASDDSGGDDGSTVVITTTTPGPTTTDREMNGDGNGEPTVPDDRATTSGVPAPTIVPDPPATMGEPEVRFTEIARMDRPVGIAVRPADPRTYLIGQAGLVVVLDPTADNGVRPVADLATLTTAQGERGLLGLSFSLDGAEAYVNRTDGNGDTIIEAYPVRPDGTFDLGAGRLLMSIEQPFGNHNGGHLLTAPDGTLLIGTGDGGSAGDPLRLALDLTIPHGKLLRIDPTPDPTTASPYRIPEDNPFVDVDGALPEIWAIGLRNPWKFSLDPVTGDLWIADVGQNEVEELNMVPAGADGTLPGRGLSFGWSAFEGTDRFNEDQPADGHVEPVLVYRHGPDGCSITGGATARGAGVPELAGGHVYGDYCSGRVWAVDLITGRNISLGEVQNPTAILPGADGELLVTSHAGIVYRIDTDR